DAAVGVLIRAADAGIGRRAGSVAALIEERRLAWHRAGAARALRVAGAAAARTLRRHRARRADVGPTGARQAARRPVDRAADAAPSGANRRADGRAVRIRAARCRREVVARVAETLERR